jgi:poly-gamma-glutamate synthesis protein (capsule biosynthesis protein)
MARTTFIATGDSFITRPIPEGGYPGFQEIADIIGQHDVRFNNLEITVHRQQGYPAAVSGGTWAMTDPEILDDLNRYGFNLYNTANNHSCDYSCGGVLATIDNLKKRGLAYAGTGATLEEAAAPGYLNVNGVRVALMGACATTDAASVAGDRNDAVIGRPGLNPLRFETTYFVEPHYFEMLKQVGEKTYINAEQNKHIANGFFNPLPEGKLTLGKLHFSLSDKNGMTTEPNKKDMDRMLRNIRKARQTADYVLISIHFHTFDDDNDLLPPAFLKSFAYQCIDAGADAILGHGPHELQGIEIYNGKPIFYSLGNFVFQTETVSVQPADAYANKGLPINSTVEQLMDHRSKGGTSGYCVQENIWRSVMAGFTAEDGKITEIKLYPITLDMHLPRKEMGNPRIADDDAVFHHLQELCKPFGTKLQIENNIATVVL